MTIRILNGDVRAMLATLPDESVHCIWTSPPYWGLRTYHTEPQIWRAPLLSECDGKDFHHIWGPKNWITGGSGIQGKDGQRADRSHTQALNRERGEFCQLCGAWRGEHGMEPSLQLWLHHEMLIWRDLRRVLRKDGVAWLNIGDAYANDGKWGGETGGKQAHLDDDNRKRVGREKRSTGLKPKDRMLMPARLAIALQDDGWWVRDEVIWSKPNPMPSSTDDRTTPAHEMLYMLTKRHRYFYDAEAIREPFAASSIARLSQDSVMEQEGGVKQDAFAADGLNERSGSRRPNQIVQGLSQKVKRAPAGWDTADGSHDILRHTSGQKTTTGGQKTTSGNKERKLGVDRGQETDSHIAGSVPWEGNSRQKRSVWSIATEPFPEAHFATAPTKLVEPCIKATTSERGCCPRCMAPWARIMAKVFVPQTDVSEERGVRGVDGQKPMDETSNWDDVARGSTLTSTLGWYPTCKCTAAPALPKYPDRPKDRSDANMAAWSVSCGVIDEMRRKLCVQLCASPTFPAVVLEPFLGSGTTAVVADRLQRDCIGIELNPAYIEMARRRIGGETPLLTEIKVA